MSTESATPRPALTGEYHWRIHQVSSLPDGLWVVVGHLSLPCGTRSGVGHRSSLEEAMDDAYDEARAAFGAESPAECSTPAAQAVQAAKTDNPPDDIDAKRSAWRALTTHPLWHIQAPGSPDGRSATVLWLRTALHKDIRSFTEVFTTDWEQALNHLTIQGEWLMGEFEAMSNLLFGTRIDARLDFIRSTLGDMTIKDFDLNIDQWDRVVAALRTVAATSTGSLSLDHSE